MCTANPDRASRRFEPLMRSHSLQPDAVLVLGLAALAAANLAAVLVAGSKLSEIFASLTAILAIVVAVSCGCSSVLGNNKAREAREDTPVAFASAAELPVGWLVSDQR